MDDKVDRVERVSVGIFGPSDCETEKERAEWVVEKDRTVRRTARDAELAIMAIGASHVTSGGGRPQGRINRYVAEADPLLCLFIFKDTFGSDSGFGLTGTEEEWERAVRERVARGRPRDIGVYFGRRTPGDPRLFEFQRRLDADHLAYYERFDELVELERHIRDKVTEFVRDYAAARAGRTRPTVQDVLDAFATSPLSLRSYPRALPDGHELPRPELDLLLGRIAANESSSTIVIGDRGSGKSAFLANLDRRLRAEGVAVLSIKSDMLAPSVTTAAELARMLHLPEQLPATIQLVAHERPVVLIIDQIDALADILDRQTERLNLLLNVVHELSGMRNVHMVVSSRPFEFQHDARLRTLAAERLDLQLPPWTEIGPVLQQHGYDAEAISDPVRELLRNPWTLNAFLELRPREIGFESLFALLGRLWDRTVAVPGVPEGTHDLVTAMVREMSANEVLWIPSLIAAGREEARDYLLERELIAWDDSRLQLGFRHQSFYEYALVRQFISGTESFARFVLDHSSGLFVRPVALAGLAYLRAADPNNYQSELATIWSGQPRTHLRALVVDFIAAQATPLPGEISIIKAMLDDDRSGPRALAAIAPYAPWFAILKRSKPFLAWMRRPQFEATHTVGVLASGASAALNDVLDLLEREWLPDAQYDPLIFSVLFGVTEWSERASTTLLRTVRRSPLAGVYDLAHQLVGSNAVFAARILRTELERAIEDISVSGARNEYETAIKRVLDREDHTHVYADLAETASEAFLTVLLPFVVRTLEANAAPDERFQHYRLGAIDVVPFGNLPLPALLEATITALTRLAANDGNRAIQFIEPLLYSGAVAVHALAAYVLQQIAPSHPRYVLTYLLRDPRNLAIGSMFRHHQFSKALIETIVPRLDSRQRRRLEDAILSYDYLIAPDDQLTEEQRARKQPWNREHRLFLLQSIPDRYLSAEAQRQKRALQSEFPGSDERIFGEISGGEVEAEYSLAALEAMPDEDIVAIFDELTDETGWDHPRRWSDGDRLVGGSVQQSRVLAEFAEKHPHRGLRVARLLRPRDQERPVGAIVEGLAKSDCEANELLNLIFELASRGFGTDEFVTSAAGALAKLARRLHGLPDAAVDLLVRWLETQEAPTPEQVHDGSDRVPAHSLLFTAAGLFMQPHGRGPVIDAVAAALLEREPASISRWIEIVRRRVGREHHRGVWVMTLLRLQDVLKQDAAAATELFDAIVTRHPDVLREPFAWRLIAHWLSAFKPREAVLAWLDLMQELAGPQPQQAAGELLYLYFADHRDETSRARIIALAREGNRNVARGLGFAAANLWDSIRTRAVGAEVLLQMIERWPQDAATVLQDLRIDDLDELTQDIYRAAAANPDILLPIFPDLGEQIEPLTADEPAFVAEIAQAVVNAPTTQVENVLGPIHRGRVPEVMTSIALTLHRLPGPYAEVGLDLFEKLLDANLREARSALDIIDRKPMQSPSWRWPRRPRRPRRPRLK